MKVNIEMYNSIKHLLDTIETRPVNKVFKNKTLGSEHSTKTFTGTQNYNEARDLFLYGYASAVEALKNIKVPVPNASKQRSFSDIVGYAPHVSNYIQGIPQSMINSKKVLQKTRTIELFYITCIDESKTTTEIIEAGKKVLQAVKTIEINQISVKLSAIMLTSSSNKKASEIALLILKLKDYQEKLDIKKIAFPLVHPSAIRRIGFKWLETVPTLKSKLFTHNYGYSICSSKFIKRILNTNGVVLSYNDIYTKTTEDIIKMITK